MKNRVGLSALFAFLVVLGFAAPVFASDEHKDGEHKEEHKDGEHADGEHEHDHK